MDPGKRKEQQDVRELLVYEGGSVREVFFFL